MTRPCQFARVAFPAFKAERIRGIFLIPPSWPCIIFAMSRFSGRMKHSTALWRAFMTSRDREGRRSHVRSSERPSVVLVLSSVPNVSRQPKLQKHEELEREPNSDNPSFVFVEWIDAWLSFSNTCSELTTQSHHHGWPSCKGEITNAHNKASALICMVLSLCDARGVRVGRPNGKSSLLTRPSSLSRGHLDHQRPQLPNRRVLSP